MYTEKQKTKIVKTTQVGGGGRRDKSEMNCSTQY